MNGTLGIWDREAAEGTLRLYADRTRAPKAVGRWGAVCHDLMRSQ
jgi:hypothetical protein